MASTKNKTKAKKKTTSNKSKKTTAIKNNFIRNEVKLIIFFTVAIILELSVFGFCGKIGEYLSYFLFGLFGMLAYVFPLLLFIGIAFLISNLNNSKAIQKLISCVVLFIILISIIQLFNYQELSVFKYYTNSAKSHLGGGFIGGLVTKGLCNLLGLLGTYLVLIVLSIICIVIITEKSFINGVKKGSTKVYNSAKDDMNRVKELRETNQSQRRDNKARGVINIKLKDAQPFSDEVHEITQEEFSDKVYRGHVEYQDIPKKKEMNIEDSYFDEPITDNISIPDKSIIDIEEVINEESSNEFNSKFDLDDAHYGYPPLNLLAKPSKRKSVNNTEHLNETALKLQQTLQNFGVKVTITDYSQGPSVTRYELQPEMGTKVSRITSLIDDIKLNLAAADIRIEAPIPGKAAVGIEVPNVGRDSVLLRELLESRELSEHPSKIAFSAGKDIGGNVVVADIAKMPHMLVAGTTGSGKSVFINSIIMTVLFRAKPSEVKLIIIDPKVVEFGVYNGIPHLLNPVVTDPKMAASVLNWAVAEMTRRYKVLAEYNVRDFKSYNDKIEKTNLEIGEEKPEKMPQILIVIDELADLMMVAAKVVEDSICRLAQLARAAGIHLIIATQRPSVDVVTGLIKANVPARVALLVSSGTDSRTIIDMNGAEKLLGNGDMLFYPSGYVKPVRVQGAFISDTEVAKSVKFLKEHSMNAEYDSTISEHITTNNNDNNSKQKSNNNNGRDEYFDQAGHFVIEREKASASMLQRKFNIGFNRAARIIDQLSELGVIGAEEGPKPRKVIMSVDEFEEIL